MATILEIVQESLDETQDDDLDSLLDESPPARRARALLNRTGRELARYGNAYGGWPDLQRQVNFTLEPWDEDNADHGDEEDYVDDEIWTIPEDWARIIPGTLYDESGLDLPLRGPIGPREHSLLQTDRDFHPTYAYRILGTKEGSRVIQVVPGVKEEVTFRLHYLSNHWLLRGLPLVGNAVGAAPADGEVANAVRGDGTEVYVAVIPDEAILGAPQATSDEDTTYLEDELLIMGFRSAWAQAKNRATANYYRKLYERERKKRYAEARGPRTISMEARADTGRTFGYRNHPTDIVR